MVVTGHKGIDIRQTTNRLIFDSFLQDMSGILCTTGTAKLYLYELESDGSLFSYDFNTNTFKSSALTNEWSTLTHRQGNNNTTNTGIWTSGLTVLSGFSVSGIYYARINHTNAMPNDQVRKFQFGSAEGDISLTNTNYVKSDVEELLGSGAIASNGYIGIDWNLVQNQGATRNFAATTINTITNYTGNTPQTGDTYAIVNNGTYGNSALKGLIDTLDDFVDTEVAAIKERTDNLPDDPADASNVAVSFEGINATLLAVSGYVDTEISAIKSVIDKLDTMVEIDGLVYRFTANSLELAHDGTVPLTPSGIRYEIDTNSTQLQDIKSRLPASLSPSGAMICDAYYLLGSGIKQSQGYIGVDLAQILNSSATVNLSGTTIKSVTDRVYSNAGVIKNTNLDNFVFKLVSSSDHLTAVTGVIVSATRSIDGAVFAVCSNSVAEIGNGFYKINLSASDLNGDVITLRFTAVGADNREITIITTE